MTSLVVMSADTVTHLAARLFFFTTSLWMLAGRVTGKS